jgi:hypothetical protein
MDELIERKAKEKGLSKSQLVEQAIARCWQ